MTSTDYRAGGANTEIYFTVGTSSLGSILVAESGKGICALFLGDDREMLVRELQARFPQVRDSGDDATLQQRLAKIISFIEAPALEFDLPLDLRGTAFQQRVWQALQAIPLGTTASYAEIARAIGSPKASRAVASACAANPVAVVIPCHRVVRSDRSLSGYRWGVERKRQLLEREAAARAAGSRVYGAA